MISWHIHKYIFVCFYIDINVLYIQCIYIYIYVYTCIWSISIYIYTYMYISIIRNPSYLFISNILYIILLSWLETALWFLSMKTRPDKSSQASAGLELRYLANDDDERYSIQASEPLLGNTWMKNGCFRKPCWKLNLAMSLKWRFKACLFFFAN